MATKKATKKKSTLNKAGIRLLADDLVAHKKMYDQDTYGDYENECGTFCCLAGFCYRREIGARKFAQWAKDKGKDTDLAEDAGRKQLGLKDDIDIFNPFECWPSDLVEEYESNGPTWRVIAALKALQRLRPDGSIDPNPKKIHTRIPQLKALLATAKKAK
jgi:hypothetical protein